MSCLGDTRRLSKVITVCAATFGDLDGFSLVWTATLVGRNGCGEMPALATHGVCHHASLECAATFGMMATMTAKCHLVTHCLVAQGYEATMVMMASMNACLGDLMTRNCQLGRLVTFVTRHFWIARPQWG